MSKRSRKDEDIDEYFRNKIRRLEIQLESRHRRKKFVMLSSSSSSSACPSPVPSIEEDADSDRPLIELAERELSEQGEAELPAIVTESDVTPEVIAPTEKIPAAASTLDDEILLLLGDTPSKEKKYAPEIQNDLALRWEHIVTSGLSKEDKKELIGKHLVPNNCKKIEAPVLNPEIKAALTETLLKKDKALENKQKQQAAAISCVSEALTLVLSSEHKDPKIIKILIEAGRIMCDSQHAESLTRRSFICSTIKKELKDQLYDTEIDKFLFGEKLADTLKAAKAINKSALDMKASIPKAPANKNKASTSKNFKSSRPLPTQKPSETTPGAPPPARRKQQPPQPTRSSKARPPTTRR